MDNSQTWEATFRPTVTLTWAPNGVYKVVIDWMDSFEPDDSDPYDTENNPCSELLDTLITRGEINSECIAAGKYERPRQEKMVSVSLEWSDKYGSCIECGLPAAFFCPGLYGENDPKYVIPRVQNKFCAVCAANRAADGEKVMRIDRFLGGEE